MAFLGGAAQMKPLMTQTVNSATTTLTHNFGTSPDVIFAVTHQATAAYCTIVNPAVSVNTFTARANADGTVVDFWLMYFNPF